MAWSVEAWSQWDRFPALCLSNIMKGYLWAFCMQFSSSRTRYLSLWCWAKTRGKASWARHRKCLHTCHHSLLPTPQQAWLINDSTVSLWGHTRSQYPFHSSQTGIPMDWEGTLDKTSFTSLSEGTAFLHGLAKPCRIYSKQNLSHCQLLGVYGLKLEYVDRSRLNLLVLKLTSNFYKLTFLSTFYMPSWH